MLNAPPMQPVPTAPTDATRGPACSEQRLAYNSETPVRPLIHFAFDDERARYVMDGTTRHEGETIHNASIDLERFTVRDRSLETAVSSQPACF